MIVRQPLTRACLPALPRIQARQLHGKVQLPVPTPTPFVPDTSTFLTLIGRGMTQHSAKIPDWNSLFSLTSKQLREVGVEPPRARRYLIWWRERFRRGKFGIGGDLHNVSDGVAEVRSITKPIRGGEVDQNIAREAGLKTEVMATRTKRVVVNESEEIVQKDVLADDLTPVGGMKTRGLTTVVAPYGTLVKGTKNSVAQIKIQNGMWEHKRGVKIDGGERRKKMVRRQKLLQSRKTSRG